MKRLVWPEGFIYIGQHFCILHLRYEEWTYKITRGEVISLVAD